jgi:hypothetical protein
MERRPLVNVTAAVFCSGAKSGWKRSHERPQLSERNNFSGG